MNFSFSLAVVAACGADDLDPACVAPPENQTVEIGPAHVVALSNYEASVGSMVEIYGTNFPSTESASTFIVLKGNFDTEDGTSEAVDIESEVKAVDKGTIRWTNFGPYRNPFSASGT